MNEFLNELKETKEKYRNETIARFNKELIESEIIHHALKTGDKIPDFELPNATGKMIDIMNFEGYKWTIINFYRGQWCPFCNIELRALEKEMSNFKKAPAKLVAISPQTPDNSLTTVEKNSLSFEVLSDVGNKVGKLFNIVFTIPEYLNKLYEGFGVDLQFYNGNGQIELPMPATYIVDRDGIIQKHFVSTYASERLDPKEVVKFLEENS